MQLCCCGTAPESNKYASTRMQLDTSAVISGDYLKIRELQRGREGITLPIYTR